MATDSRQAEQFSSKTAFLLSTIGFCVGLGNIWRFPYVTGEYGGSAFLFVYLACALCIGLPLLIAELAIGRHGKGSATGCIDAVARIAGISRAWRHVGTLAIFCVWIIFSYYTVLSGWTFDYFLRSASGAFENISGYASATMFDALMADPARLLFWHTVVNLLIIAVVGRGVQAGVEKSMKILMPVLFAALITMVIYSAIAGDLKSAMRFLLEPDFSKLSFQTVMVAIGQAFFSIGIGMAALMTFGAYLPKDVSIPGCAVTIVLADTGVSLLAGFAIFPLVFAFGLEPSSGASLIFKTLPIAFGQMPGGQIFGALFFLLLIAAAVSSCIGCSEAVVCWVHESLGIDRHKGIMYAVGSAWLVGLLSIMSLGDWSTYYPLGFIRAFENKTIFDALDFLAANVLLLTGGLLLSVLVGWRLPAHILREELSVAGGGFFRFWRFTLRFLIPPVLFVSLLLGIIE